MDKTDTRKLVPRFWLQATKSFPDGAPQREEYNTDQDFHADCLVYAQEWRETYRCGNTDCQNRDCPEHFPEAYQSSGDPLCEGCQWRSDKSGQWCDMFRESPDVLPCAQHDKFEPIRRAAVNSGMANLVIAAALISIPPKGAS